MYGTTKAETAVMTALFVLFRVISIHVVLSGFALLTEVMKR